MAKYSEYHAGMLITHYIVSTNQIFYNTGPFEQQFPKINFEVQLGIDESTTQTGICIADMKGNPVMLIDIINRSLPKAEIYLTLLRQWVNRTLPNINIKRIIYEEINQNAPQQYARKRLLQVANIFEDYVANCEDDIEIVCINNKTWKKHLLIDSKYDHRRVKTELVKAAVQEAVEDLIPSILNYKLVYYNGDSCDAVGIIYGYCKECFTDDTCANLQVNSTMKSTPLRAYTKKYIELDELIKLSKQGQINIKGYKKAKYNPNFTLENNCLRAINYNRTGVILYGLDASESLKTIIQFDSNGKVTNKTVLLVRAKNI